MLVIDIMDFYTLLQVEVNEHLNNLYTLLIQQDDDEDPNSTIRPNVPSAKKKKIDKIYMALMSALQHRNHYCEQNSKNITLQHEIILMANGLEQNLMEMFKRPRVCNRENIKFVQMFMTILDLYLGVIWSLETNTRIQYSTLNSTINTIFSRIKST